jgi:F-type H+-transporting ATPase subunit a
LSLRLFGNIMSGSIIMTLVYALAAYVSGFIPLLGRINIVGIFLAPMLHVYFDLFAGLIQTFIFITLTTIFIGNELTQE